MTGAVHPGEHLADELRERGWTQQTFADICGRPAQWANEIINGKKAITPRSAAEIGAAFGTSAEFWLNLQTLHEVERIAQDRALRPALRAIRRRSARHGGEVR